MVEWRKLIDVADVKYGYPFDSALFSEDCTYIPLIRIRDVKPGVPSTFYIGEYSTDYIIKKGDILVGMDGEFNLAKWNDRDGLLNQRVLKLSGKEGLCYSGFLFHYMGPVFKKIEKQTAGGSVKHLSAKVINKIEIPVPSLTEQNRIVGILDTFTASIDNLKQQIEQRKKQYEHYRDKLLDFTGREDVVWKNLANLCEIGTGSSNTNEGIENGLYPFYTRGQEVLSKNEYEYDDCSIITSGDGVGVGKVFHFTNGKYALHQRAYRIHVINEDVVNSKFLYYYFLKTFLSYILKNSFFSSVTSLRKPMLVKFPVPVLSLTEQLRIVSILDTFTTSIANLEQQLEQRQRQYEYYRNKLLTFE